MVYIVAQLMQVYGTICHYSMKLSNTIPTKIIGLVDAWQYTCTSILDYVLHTTVQTLCHDICSIDGSLGAKVVHTILESLLPSIEEIVR